MKLKCVGGLNNGEYGFTFDDRPRVGERVQTRIAKEFTIDESDEIEIDLEKIRDRMVESVVVYIVDRDYHDCLFLRPL